MTAAKLRLAMASMGQPETKVGDLCAELGLPGRRSTGMCRGELRPDGVKVALRGQSGRWRWHETDYVPTGNDSSPVSTPQLPIR